MAMDRFPVTGVVNGREQPLPSGLQSLIIRTPSGGIQIDLEVEDLGGVLVRGLSLNEGEPRPAVIMSPLHAGLLLLGVAPGKS